MSKKKTPKLKWNRRHEFARKKSTRRQVGHPVYIYGQRGRDYKYLTVTHKPEEGKENDYEKLKHNIDPNEHDRHSYLKKKYSVSPDRSFDPPDKKYRFHPDDLGTVKKYKK